MSLQSRLFTFFIAIVVLPLGLAALLGQQIIVSELEQRVIGQVEAAATAATLVYQEKESGGRAKVQLIASSTDFSDLLLDQNYQELERYVLNQIQEERAVEIDYAIVADPVGNVLAAAFTEAEFLPGAELLSAEEIVRETGEVTDPRQLMVTRSILPINDSEGNQIAVVVGGAYLDNDFLASLSRGTGVDAHVFIEERLIASSLVSAEEGEVVTVDLGPSAVEGFLRTDIGGESVYAVPSQFTSDMNVEQAAFVMTTSQAPIQSLTRSIRTYLVVLVVLAAIGSAGLGFSLARVIARPLRELAAGANAIAAGNYEQHIEVRSRDEVGQLARAFNEMTQRLAAHIAELKESREELKRALTRFADALRSTHNLERMLELVLDTSVDVMRAQAGLLMWMSPARDSLKTSVSRGFDHAEFELALGEGVAGTVAMVGEPIKVPDSQDAPMPSAKEPEFRTALSVPIFSEERVIAVLSVFDKEGGQNFTEADLGTLLSLADQAGVAIENVLLHQEAKRQAIMDAVVGTWNRRYFDIRLGQEVDRAKRFQRPFSVILLDIDDFKLVNDAHGHQRGDAVLIELASRIHETIRDIDVLARYGGEEFVLILPETDTDGAVRTAEKIRAVIADESFKGDPVVTVTVSLGVATFPGHGEDPLRAADQALYDAKAAGKNCVKVWGGPEDGRASSRDEAASG